MSRTKRRLIGKYKFHRHPKTISEKKHNIASLQDGIAIRAKRLNAPDSYDDVPISALSEYGNKKA